MTVLIKESQLMAYSASCRLNVTSLINVALHIEMKTEGFILLLKSICLIQRLIYHLQP